MISGRTTGASLRGSEAAEAIQPLEEKAWIASLALAMTRAAIRLKSSRFRRLLVTASHRKLTGAGAPFRDMPEPAKWGRLLEWLAAPGGTV
jgi:hypothetical protein